MKQKILASVLMVLFIVGLVSATPVIVSESEPVLGKIIDYEFMGTLPPDFDGIYDVDIYYITYETYGGLHIKGMLGVPVTARGRARAPKEGWPVTVFMHGGFGHGAWGWPFVGDWTDTPRTWHSLAWASHGFVSLSIWLPGNPPSEGTYTPVSKANAKATLDGLRAVINLAEEHPKILKVDETRLVVLGNCLGSQTLIRLASIWPSYAPELQIKVLGVSTFNPSLIMWSHWKVTELALKLPPGTPQASVIVGSTAVVMWELIEEENIPYTVYFKEDAIEFLQTPIETPAGVYPRVRAGPAEASVGIWIFQYLYGLWGHVPTAMETLDWIFADEIVEFFNSTTIEEKVAHPLYQLIADYDPLTEGNIRPFNPGIPLLVVHAGTNLPGGNYEYIHMGTRNREVVEGWGWEVYYFYDPEIFTSLMTDAGHTWAVNKALEILYP